MQNLSKWDLLFLLSRVNVLHTTIKLKSVSEKNDKYSSYTLKLCYLSLHSNWEGWVSMPFMSDKDIGFSNKN